MLKINKIRRATHHLREGEFYRLFFYNKDHIWLSSFPRSGNTWIRHMLHEILSNEPSDSKNIRQTIPDIHNHWDILNLRKSALPYVKTHFPYSDYQKKVVYIIRNPFDTIYSYWKLVSNDQHIAISLDDFISDQIKEGYIYGRWDRHILSYINSGLKQNEILILKYEDLVVDPYKGLVDILMFSSIYESSSRIQEVINKYTNSLIKSGDRILNSATNRDNPLFKNQVGKGLRMLNEKQIDMILDSPLREVVDSLDYLNLLSKLNAF